MANYKVYISSTYRDLAPYRQTVMKSLQKAPNFKVIGMEYYTAEDTQPLERCLKDVSDCDIYILILANRYGYVLDGQDFSITHQEYLRARALNKVILVFKAENRDVRFPADDDEDNQPSSIRKQTRLKSLKDEVGSLHLSHPEGFTSEYHLALQVMESLVRNPRVDFDGELPEDRKIFCDRANQVFDFYDFVRKKQAFNVFLIQGHRTNLGRSLVDRLSRYYLGISDPTLISYHEFITDASYPNFRRRLINELCDRLLPNDPNPPIDPESLLSDLKASGTLALAMLSLVSNSVQWQKGYEFLDKILLEFKNASERVGGIRVFWFVVIDTPDALQQQVNSVDIKAAPPLTELSETDIENWLRTYIISDDEIVLSLQELCFPNTLKSPCQLNMRQAQEQIRAFINRFNLRRKASDLPLLSLLP
ncbi:protein of unknown function [Hymenobacter gelipurpurascens]|uniref:Uncharacterized protein n=1 Tax=Hymenobacter gelipurpurascens TaxID=89968 RepID=A0A212UHU8_9BACT|nr:DUF4062 domain-containing protein [Hymenobacter gelipurpurascens]SNC77634.1 protein of unknown function [Hymenobacter gelipurpurascens]